MNKEITTNRQRLQAQLPLYKIKIKRDTHIQKAAISQAISIRDYLFQCKGHNPSGKWKD
jgi:hypothetical protein